MLLTIFLFSNYIIILRQRVSNGWVYIVCSETPFGVDSYRMESSQFICIPNQLLGFCIVRVSVEENYRVGFH